MTIARRSQQVAPDHRGYLAWSYRLEKTDVDPRRVAVIVCDMWDRHWSRAAMDRGNAIAVRIDAFLRKARAAGMAVVHAPSETMKVYQDAPARRRILEVPQLALPEARAHANPPLPIDDTDGGSDTNSGTEDTDAAVWTRQTDLISIDQAVDVISDNGAEIYSYMRARGIQTILISGVHTNMCVLNRSFAIRSFTTRGLDIVLLRDLTDSLYNPSRPPYVSHDEGTELIIGYIEKFWCPSVASTEIMKALDAGEVTMLLPFQDPDQPVERRVKDLLGRLTLAEKVSQMVYDSAAIPRLGIPEYNWWNEALHGVGRSGVATVFPQAIALASTFDTTLMHRVAAAISDEARAKHHEFARQGYRRQYHGLTFWSPNVNIFRDPRWGRGQETYGEDPWLTGRMGVAFVKGLQGDDPAHPKVAATPKHYAVHSGPEALRHHFDARVSPRDLRETYLPAFRDCVVEGGALSVMGAYNRTNGEPCCGSAHLLGTVLREEWGFTGYVVSDCGAIHDFHANHTVTSTPAQSAAMAVRNGCDLECGSVYPALNDAVKEGLISEAEIDTALGRLLAARFRLGMFDPPRRSPHSAIPYERIDCEEHRALALDAARASLVLLKNARGTLPLRRDLGCIAVIGPNADDRDVLLGNYAGLPSRSTTVLEGIRAAVGPRTRILYAQGSEITKEDSIWWDSRADDGFAEALAAADAADVVVMVLGLSNKLEGEEGAATSSQWNGDRISIELPAIQRRLFKAVAAKGKPTVLVVLTGSALAMVEEHERAEAVLLGWYPGEEGGTAVAEVLFGAQNPSGRLPVTFVRSLDQLPPFTDYEMKGRTYRYMTEEPLYPFGYGLSYSSFAYKDLALSEKKPRAGATVTVAVEVSNTSTRDGHEVVQVYVSAPTVPGPLRQLVGFQRVWIPAGDSRKVSFTLGPRELSTVGDDGTRAVRPGRYRLAVGGRQPDSRSASLTGTAVREADIEITGVPHVLPA